MFMSIRATALWFAILLNLSIRSKTGVTHVDMAVYFTSLFFKGEAGGGEAALFWGLREADSED